MKLPITDQFLYDLYNFLEPAGEAIHLITRRHRLGETLFAPGNPVFEKYRKTKNRRDFNKLVYYLKRKNFIQIKNFQNRRAILITKRGIDKIIKASFKMEEGKRIKRKDGKWIMVIFDIPQNKKRDRILLRSVLKNLGYKLYQHSVWICPFDVSEKTEKFLQYYFLDKYVRIFLVDEV